MANEKSTAAPKSVEAPAASETPAKKSPMLKMTLMAAIVLALEGGTVGITMMASGGPKKVTAESLPAATTKPASKDVEIELLDAHLPNRLSGGGSLYIYDLQVVTTAEKSNETKLTELCKERKASIQDRIRTIVASADPKTLSEPGLETLRRQIAYQVEEAVGKELIKEVLIPKCTPMRGDY
ncbi:MAG: hypothetical protein FWD61_06045 [Phycisphaerales bacterium]|nr:hypothetical protein [Phycisphaerales bacterium]